VPHSGVEREREQRWNVDARAGHGSDYCRRLLMLEGDHFLVLGARWRHGVARIAGNQLKPDGMPRLDRAPWHVAARCMP
jgi:hypothetical protein